jgi:arylsulfatase A-like enzyme
MARTRREFLTASASAAAALALDPAALARTAGRPNVLVLIIDTLRADHVGAYGGRALTPNIDDLARQGLRGGQLGRRARHMPESRRLVRQWLVPELREPNIEARVHRFLAAAGTYWDDESRSCAAKVFSAGAEVLLTAAAHQPFAVVADTYEPHEPWTPPRDYIDLYGDAAYRGPEPCTSRYARVSEWLSRQRAGPVLRRIRDLYAAEVTMTDRWLGVMTGRLRELRLDRNTVIVLVADHGYLLGEHGWTGRSPRFCTRR